MVIVTSLPTMANATWLTTSGMTGFTLPGMMLDPACRGGRWISASPACGPDDSRRRSLQIFDSFTAIRRRTPDSWTKAPTSEVDSTRSGAATIGRPVISASTSTTLRAYPGSAAIPVPMAVAPRLTSCSAARACSMPTCSAATVAAHAPNSWPTVIGTASWSCVRPTLRTPANSTDLAPRADPSAARASASPSSADDNATFTAVG